MNILNNIYEIIYNEDHNLLKLMMKDDIDLKKHINKNDLDTIISSYENFRKKKSRDIDNSYYWFFKGLNKLFFGEIPDEPTAFTRVDCFKRSSEIDGNDFAFYFLGKYYLFDEGIDKKDLESIELGIFYIKESAAKNNFLALYLLGNLYDKNYNFNYLNKNDYMAYKNYFDSAIQGYKLALKKVGEFYLNGRSVDKSIIKGIYYLILSGSYTNNNIIDYISNDIEIFNHEIVNIMRTRL